MKQPYLPYVDPLTFDIYAIEHQFLSIRCNDPFSNTLPILQDVLSILNDPSIISPEERRIFFLYAEVGSALKASNFCGKKKYVIAKGLKEVKKKVYRALQSKGWKLYDGPRTDIYYKTPSKDDLIVETDEIIDEKDELTTLLFGNSCHTDIHY